MATGTRRIHNVQAGTTDRSYDPSAAVFDALRNPVFPKKPSFSVRRSGFANCRRSSASSENAWWAGRNIIKKLIKRYKTPKAKDTQPVIDFEAIFIPDGSKEAGLLIPQLAFHDIRNVYLLGTNRWYSPALINMAKSFVQGGILPVGFFPDSVSPAVAEFVSRFENDFGQKPGFIEAVAYDTAMILFQVMGQPGMSYRSAIRDSLLSVSSYPGLTGLTTFREDGDVEKQIDLLKIIDDRFVELAR